MKDLEDVLCTDCSKLIKRTPYSQFVELKKLCSDCLDIMSSDWMEEEVE